MKTEGLRVYYQSTVRGITEKELDTEEIVYNGIVVRIPEEDFPEDMVKYEPDIQELFQDIERHGYIYEYVPGGVVERYEIREIGSGDCIALWRVPFRLKDRAKAN